MRGHSPHQRNALVLGRFEIMETMSGDTLCRQSMLSNNAILTALMDELEQRVNFEIERSES